MTNPEKITLQEYADRVIAPEYRQPLKTLEQAVTSIGWPFIDRPTCCDAEVEVSSFIGSPYFAECKSCGRFIVDMSGPSFGNSWVQLPDKDKIDLDTETRWIAGVQQKDAAQ